MVFLKVAHTNDNDCDLFCFSDLLTAIQYINIEQLSDWALSDMEDGYQIDDYTHIVLSVGQTHK